MDGLVDAGGVVHSLMPQYGGEDGACQAHPERHPHVASCGQDSGGDSLAMSWGGAHQSAVFGGNEYSGS